MYYDDQPRSPILGRLLIAGVLAIISLITYYSHSTFNPVVGEKQHVDLSPDQEIQLGLKSAPQMEQQYGGESADPRATAEVRRVGEILVTHTEAGKTAYRFQFHLLRDPRTVNAFALPGGQVFITEGLFHKLKSPGQLAGVLGHEIGHVVARHSAQQLAKQRLTQGLGGAAVIASSDPRDGRGGQNAALAMAITQLVNLRFSRQDELQADKLGVRFTTESGFDPRSMIDVMHILQQEAQGQKTPEFFATHPDPGKRIERIEAEIKELPGGVPAGAIK